MAVMKASEFVAKLKDVAQNYKTLYVMGCFGAPDRGQCVPVLHKPQLQQAGGTNSND